MPPTPVIDPTRAPRRLPVPSRATSPSLAAVRDDIPVIYADACHAESRETQPRASVHGEAGLSTSCS